MSQVCTYLGLEARGLGGTGYHHLASLPRLQQPGSATSTPIFWSERHLGSGESAAGSKTGMALPSCTESWLPLLQVSHTCSPAHCHSSLGITPFPAASSFQPQLGPLFLGSMGSCKALLQGSVSSGCKQDSKNYVEHYINRERRGLCYLNLPGVG